MNVSDRRTIRLAHDYTLISYHMAKKISHWLPSYQYSDLIIVCIGTDRSTGDSLGPLTGTILKERQLKNFTVYGNLHEPIHALNLDVQLSNIYSQHKDPFVIAIDACLGKVSSVGDIIAGIGSIKPGSAVDKQLSAVGDIYMTGVINVSGFLEYTVLQSTRLSLVVDMANTIAKIIHAIDFRLNLLDSHNNTENHIL